MREEMKHAVETMLKTDNSVPDAVRTLAVRMLGLDPLDDEKTIGGIRDLLNGDAAPESMQPIVTRSEAARILRVKPHTVDLYGRMGILQRIYGSGSKKIGFTRESVLRKASGELVLAGTYKVTSETDARTRARDRLKERGKGKDVHHR